MPTYLCHGFRWSRASIRLFVILADLEDAASDWLAGRRTSALVVGYLHNAFDFIPLPADLEEPKSQDSSSHSDDDATVCSEEADFELAEKSELKLLEEFNVEERSEPSRPFAYVADYAVRIDLSANVGEEMAKYERISKARGESWLAKLRDYLEDGADIMWYVVVCGDEERPVPEGNPDDNAEEDVKTPTEDLSKTPAESRAPAQDDEANETLASKLSESPDKPKKNAPPLRHKPSKARGLLRLFGKKDS